MCEKRIVYSGRSVTDIACSASQLPGSMVEASASAVETTTATPSIINMGSIGVSSARAAPESPLSLTPLIDGSDIAGVLRGEIGVLGRVIKASARTCTSGTIVETPLCSNASGCMHRGVAPKVSVANIKAYAFGAFAADAKPWKGLRNRALRRMARSLGHY